ncbi:YqzH family protein [Neobacillus sp. OS1-33]|uniref:YqzH family protein n=1 Tax=Neobacillus sp. OS1-33 TaxID=3070683 RepID=UPI0027E13FB1|nr:YqzH family protein [Neobacillus sp. OS1-33]WML25697.1 YqzH family protein [Neobacillus sp. OS1-33]
MKNSIMLVRCIFVDKKLVVKMIKNCFKQYYKGNSTPIGDRDLEELVEKILQTKKEEPGTNLYEVVNDTVYEYLAE